MNGVTTATCFNDTAGVGGVGVGGVGGVGAGGVGVGGVGVGAPGHPFTAPARHPLVVWSSASPPHVAELDVKQWFDFKLKVNCRHDGATQRSSQSLRSFTVFAFPEGSAFQCGTIVKLSSFDEESVDRMESNIDFATHVTSYDRL